MNKPILPILPAFKAFNPKDANPCAGCSNCCEYLSLEIDKPTTPRDFDQIRWYIIHQNVWVYIDDEGDWYIQFNTPCEKLENNRCSYYPYRPHICRAYKPAECVRYSEEPAEKFLFKNELDLWKYLSRRRPAMFKKVLEKVQIPEDLKKELEGKIAVAV